MSLFDADDYLSLSEEPVALELHFDDETDSPAVAPVVEQLADLPEDAPEALVEALLEEVQLVEVGPPEEVESVEVLIEPEPEVVETQAVEAEVAEAEPELPAVWAPSVDVLWEPVRFQAGAAAALRASTKNPVHAYLLVGQVGNGTLAAARSFGAALLCPRGGCAQCHVCLRVLDSAHPDVVVVEREGPSITVDQAREIIRLAMRSPVETDRKVLILTDFHLVTAAAPTLLKIIEEPPESTIFVIQSDHLPPDLVTIASRCVQIPFVTPTTPQLVSALIESGLDEARAQRVASASGGQLERAFLLATDDHLAGRLSFWELIPARLDGSGAAVSSLAAEAILLLDSAARGPLEARQAAEVAALEARLELTKQRGTVGLKKELAERHKRELKRLRDDELRLGLAVLVRAYRDALVGSLDAGGGPETVLRAVAAIEKSNEHLERNPNLALLLQSLFLHLPKLNPTR